MKRKIPSLAKSLKFLFIAILLLPIGSCKVKKELAQLQTDCTELGKKNKQLVEVNKQLTDTLYLLKQQLEDYAAQRDRLQKMADEQQNQIYESKKHIADLETQNQQQQQQIQEVKNVPAKVITKTYYQKDTVQAIYAPDYKKAIQTITTHNADELNILEYDLPRKLTIGVSFIDTEDSLIVDMVQVSYANYDSTNAVVFHRAIKRSQLPFEIEYLKPKLTYKPEDFTVQCLTGDDTQPRLIANNSQMLWSWNISSVNPGKHPLTATMLTYGYNQNTENQSTNYKIFDRLITVNDTTLWTKFSKQLPAFAVEKMYYAITFLLGAAGSRVWKKISPEEEKA